MSDDDAKTALDASESWRGKMVKVGYDAERGTRFPLPAGTPDYFYYTDNNTCEDGCTCHANAPYTPTIQPNRIEQQFEYPGVTHGGKTYTITIKASAVLWDYAGTCRPNVVKTALSVIPKHHYYAEIIEGVEPTEFG